MSGYFTFWIIYQRMKHFRIAPEKKLQDVDIWRVKMRIKILSRIRENSQWACFGLFFSPCNFHCFILSVREKLRHWNEIERKGNQFWWTRYTTHYRRDFFIFRNRRNEQKYFLLQVKASSQIRIILMMGLMIRGKWARTIAPLETMMIFLRKWVRITVCVYFLQSSVSLV